MIRTLPGTVRKTRALRLAWVFLLGACACLRSPLAAVPPNPEPPMPHLFPDYVGITLPPNIAPLNFRVEEAGTRYRAEFRSVRGGPIVLASRKPSLEIPPRPWARLLRANQGQPLYCSVSVQNPSGQWRTFRTVTNFIAQEPIDPCLVYRLLKPLYNRYRNVGIYQRNLESFEQRPVLENRKSGWTCLNCHTFLNGRPEMFALHVRGAAQAHPMLLVRSNQVTRVDRTLGYLSWHPSGRLLAFSANQLSLFSHTVGETRDVYDARSNLGLFRIDSNTVVFPPVIAQPDRNETWPAWAPDGRTLYYCSALPRPLLDFRQVKYDLMRVTYDIRTDQWGQPEVLFSAAQSKLSASQPRVSPDGRYLLFCLAECGTFPVYHPDSDLCLMDLKTGSHWRLPINSDQADSWHCWSTNGRWVVFSSKRLDGLFARPHFAYVDTQGRFSKPFLLPQKDPGFYDTCLETFNLPEFARGPVTATENDLAKAISNPERILSPNSEGPAPGQPPAEAAGEGQSGSSR